MLLWWQIVLRLLLWWLWLWLYLLPVRLVGCVAVHVRQVWRGRRARTGTGGRGYAAPSELDLEYSSILWRSRRERLPLLLRWLLLPVV